MVFPRGGRHGRKGFAKIMGWCTTLGKLAPSLWEILDPLLIQIDLSIMNRFRSIILISTFMEDLDLEC